MKDKQLLFKITTVALSLAALSFTAVRMSAQPNIIPVCRGYVALCSTATSQGTCGTTARDCQTCYGDDGSVLPNAPDCQ
jgi:hypothetical protein